MNLAYTVTQEELADVLLHVAPVRPVFIWGAPGIGKSSLVEQFAAAVGLECVSLLGSQLAPEDIIGIPQIRGDVSVFLPPKKIARKEPYCLFLDELNACSQEVQKAFYSLILDRRIGEYHLPAGSVVIGAGNRTQDGAIVKTMSSALINRMFHVELKVSPKQWLAWAYTNDLHPFVTDYIAQRPDHLFSEPPKIEEPYSTPRSWHMLSDLLKEYGFGGGNDIENSFGAAKMGTDAMTEAWLRMLAYGCVSPSHAGMFLAYTKQLSNRYLLSEIIKGEARWPSEPSQRDVLYFLAQSFRAQHLKQLPEERRLLNKETQMLTHRAKALMKELSSINYEIAQMVVSSEGGQTLPDWFMVEIIRDLPRLVKKMG